VIYGVRSLLVALLLLSGCAERFTICSCTLVDYAYDSRKGGGAQETDSSSACDCGANRKRAEQQPDPRR